MKTVPKLNGPISLDGTMLPVVLPLTYGGDFSAAKQFPLEKSESPVLVFETDTSIPAEGYRLTVKTSGITLASWDENGAYYGVQTLFQLLREHGNSLPCGEYQDAPRFRYRGFMIDSGRHFFPLREVKKMVDQCAKLKLNILHWHLSEDQGFRIESKKFPRLNEIASWRTEKDGSRYGGYYTQDEIKELVAYAGERYVEVIPEIDLPGHTTAIVSAFPELSCSGEPVDVPCTWGIFPRILCGGNEKVYSFLEELLGEVCALFPSRWFHIGGDEAPKSEWEKCPKCQAEMEKHGLQNEEELQALFTARLADILEKNGKAIIGWNEILASGKMKESAVAQYWTDQGAEYSAREIPKGRKFIFSNTSSFYFDYDPSLVTLEGAYSYEPYIPGGEDVKPEQVLGLEAPLWSERIETPERLEFMAFPRLAALAENAWSKERDYPDFLERLKAYEALWKEQGVNAQPVEEAAVYNPRKAAEAMFRQFRAWADGKSEEEFKRDMAGINEKVLRAIVSPVYTEEELRQLREELGKLAES